MSRNVKNSDAISANHKYAGGSACEIEFSVVQTAEFSPVWKSNRHSSRHHNIKPLYVVAKTAEQNVLKCDCFTRPPVKWNRIFCLLVPHERLQICLSFNQLMHVSLLQFPCIIIATACVSPASIKRILMRCHLFSFFSEETFTDYIKSV